MWETVGTGATLSRELPCLSCGHAAHTFLPCSETCRCTPGVMPGEPVLVRRRQRAGIVVTVGGD